MPRAPRPPTRRWCGPPAGSRCRTPRCGSCARPAGRCRSTARSARASACSSRAAGPTSSPRSPCSRCAATGSTRRSSSPTSWCRCRRSASTSTSSPGVGPVVARPIRSRADLAQLRDLTPEDVPDITESVRLLTAELGATPLIGFAGAPVHPRVVPRRGRPVEEPRAHQGADARRPAAVARPVRPARPDLRGVPARAGAGRRLRRAAVRLVGRRAQPRRLHGIRAGRTRPRRSPRSPTSTCPASTSASAPASCSR